MTAWLTKSDKQRLDLYEENAYLYQGEYTKVWRELKPEDPKFRPIIMGDARTITDAMANLLFREPPDYKAESVPESQGEIDRLVRQMNLNTLLKKQETWGSVYGDMVFLLRKDEKGLVRCDYVHPKYFFGIFDPFNVDKLLSASLCYKFKHTGADAQTKEYLLKKIYVPGKIITELWEVKGKDIIAQVALTAVPQTATMLPVEETGLNEDLLVFHSKNMEEPGNPYGCSDYTCSLKTKFRARSQIMTQFDQVRAKHSDPKLAVPQQVLDSFKEGGEKITIRKDDLEVVGLSQGEEVAYITWDGQLTAAEKEDDKLYEQILDEAKISPALLGKTTSNSMDGTDTGRSSVMKLQTSLGLAHTKQQALEPTIKNLILVAQKFENVGEGKKSYTPSEIKVVFKDGLFSDDLTDAQVMQARLAMGTISRKEAIIRLDGTTENEANRMLQEIEDEKTSFPASVSSAGGGAQDPGTSDAGTGEVEDDDLLSGAERGSVQEDGTLREDPTK